MFNNRLTNDFLVRTRPQLQLLSPDQIYQIHLSSLEVLERTGVEVLLPEAVDLLKQAGAYVTDNQRVRIPSHLVEEALRLAPCRITISDRNGKPAMFLEGHNTYYGTGPTIQYVLDVNSGERRDSTKDDIEKAAMICDYLDNIDYVMTMGMSGGVAPSSKGINPEITDRYDFEAMLSNTTKPLIFSTWSVEGLSDCYEMGLAVSGSPENFRRKPFIIHYAEPTTPLLHGREALEQLLFCAEKRIPMVYSSGPVMGGTAPVTLAGSLVLSNAEWLGGLVIAQLKRKGTPMIYGLGVSPLDMRTSVTLYGGPDNSLSHIAAKEMASFYRLPDFNTGGCSDSKVFDQQAAIESFFSLFQAALAGSNLVHDVGYIESGYTACWESIIMADELIDSIKHFLRGIEINRDTLALDLIDKVGPGGSFIREEHTANHFKDIWYPKLFNRNNFEKWVQGGSKPLGKVLNEKVKWILENHKPEPLSKDVKQKINKILRRAEKKYNQVDMG
ncbi:MAG: trimethylamine methyltransferase family protein [Desulfobacteraceae bacterium]|nr:trimethylamine methyltransferase family protein [Desulfobacteraceae bacterium]